MSSRAKKKQQTRVSGGDEAIDPIDLHFASMMKQAQEAIALGVDSARQMKASLADYVLVIADTSHRATVLLVSDIAGKDVAETALRGWISLVSKDDVARALRRSNVNPWADFVEREPLAEGKVRLLFSANGKVRCIDAPVPAPMPKPGSA